MTHKIKPYIPRKLSPNSPEQYLACIKHRPKTLPRFILPNQVDQIDLHLDFFESKKFSKLFLRMAKHLKYVQDLRIKIFNILANYSRPSQILYFIKRMSKVKILEVHNTQEAGYLTTFSHLWPKYMKDLKTLSFNNAYSNSSLPAFRPVQTSHLKSVKSIRFISRYQKRLKDLEIHFSPNQRAENLHPQFSCPSLQKLAFIGGHFQLSVPSTSFDQFPNLKTLQLDFSHRTSPAFLNSILCLLPKIPNLESLSFMCPNVAFPGLEESFRSMKVLTMLKSVRIHDCDLSLPHSKVLLKVLKNFSLQSLSLKIQVKEVKEVSLILNLLGRLTQLEVLNLEICDRNNVLEPSIVKKILEKVDNLNSLKRLSITTWLASSKKPVDTTVELPLSNLFTKSTPLEIFKISFYQFQISNKALFGLLKTLSKRASYFKKLNLRIGETILEQKEFQKLLNFLKNFSEIRVLKLPMIGIHKKGYFMELADTVWTMKNLRSLGVGKLFAPAIGAKFFQGVEKLLCKNGLVEFTCNSSKDFKKKMENVESVIDWKKIEKMNPMLQQIIVRRTLFPEKSTHEWE